MTEDLPSYPGICFDGAKIEMPRNHCKNPDRLPFIDPPYRHWAHVEDQIFLGIIYGTKDPLPYVNTEIGAIMNMGS